MSARTEKRFREAAEKRQLCELVDEQGRTRIVAPLGEFYTQEDSRCFAVYQYSGYSSRKLPAFLSLPVESVKRMKTLDIHFNTHKDFDPENSNTYHLWIWHLPMPNKQSLAIVNH
jgi:hypothetical protein